MRISPWEKLARNTTAPAKITRFKHSGSSSDGPRVTTIFVRRNDSCDLFIFCRDCSSNAAMTGNGLPSSTVKKCAAAGRNIIDFVCDLYFSMAASVSPPPATLNALLSAMALAMACVPVENCSISKAPIGPFHKWF